MIKHRNIVTIIVVCLVLIAGGGVFSACAQIQAIPQGSQQSSIDTAVAATLVQYIIETKVAAQSASLGSEVVAQAQPTSTPLPTATPAPTEPPTPTEAAPTATTPPQPTDTAAPTAVAYPQIYAEQNTNCRLGPGTRYIVDGLLAKGQSSVVRGRDSSHNWWYIEHPEEPGGFCWVWNGSTIVEGDASKLEVVEAPTTNMYKTSNVFGDYTAYNPYYYPYLNPYQYCGQVINGIVFPKCPTKVKNCNQTNWINCNPYFYNCTCKANVKNSCKNKNCPPITQVNFWSYCDKYPKCCK